LGVTGCTQVNFVRDKLRYKDALPDSPGHNTPGGESIHTGVAGFVEVTHDQEGVAVFEPGVNRGVQVFGFGPRIVPWSADNGGALIEVSGHQNRDHRDCKGILRSTHKDGPASAITLHQVNTPAFGKNNRDTTAMFSLQAVTADRAALGKSVQQSGWANVILNAGVLQRKEITFFIVDHFVHVGSFALSFP
jgi:hypothetical protein